ncbi:hypothetical protein T484DRAFT_1880252 [Baffinella frigidus]|nr:hypothetical protein T484DRAFT_1880252 [Cryptophyta sp. CCMP2293]
MPKRVSDVCAAAEAGGEAGAPKRHCAEDDSSAEAGCAHTRAESPANDCFDAPWMPGTDLQYLKNLQKLNPQYNPHLKYVSYRTLLVSFIIDFCEDLKLQHVTVHRALNYLDRLLSKRPDVSRQSYQLVATACIFVAAKFEEQPNNVPTLSVFAKANIAGLEKKQQLIEAERVLLESLQWNALSATHLHFSHCYINKGVLCKTDTIDSKPASKQDLRVIHKYIEFLAKLCLQDYPLLKYEQALVSAAAVAVARGACRIDNVWPAELAAMVGYSKEDIQPCYDRINSLFRDSPPGEKPSGDKSAATSAPSSTGITARPSPKCVVDEATSFLAAAPETPKGPAPPTLTKVVDSTLVLATPKPFDTPKPLETPASAANTAVEKGAGGGKVGWRELQSVACALLQDGDCRDDGVG